MSFTFQLFCDCFCTGVRLGCGKNMKWPVFENKMLREIFICKTGRQVENSAWWGHLQFTCHKRMTEWHYTWRRCRLLSICVMHFLRHSFSYCLKGEVSSHNCFSQHVCAFEFYWRFSVFQLNGDDIGSALSKQIVHYNIHTSLFDIVVSDCL
jgi:hypothetical protein